MIKIPLNIATNRLIAVYSVHIAAHDGPLWIGISAASQVWQMIDTRKNPIIRQMIEHDGNPSIVVHLLTDDVNAAKLYAHEMKHSVPSAAAAIADTHPPILGRRVRRADGEEYASAREASRANNVNPSNMSKHLNRKPGHDTISGRYFSWIDN